MSLALTVKDLFDPDHLSWVFTVGPAIIVAAAIIIDNRYFGPYFALVDVVFNDFGVYSWRNPKILRSLTRRAGYVAGMGVLLNLAGYQLIDVAAVGLLAGGLLIWPAFGRPLPVPARKSDWQVLLVWTLYVATVVLLAIFGAKLWAIIRVISGQDPWEFLRGNLAWAMFCGAGVIVLSAFRAGLQGRAWQGDYWENPYGENPPDGQSE